MTTRVEDLAHRIAWRYKKSSDPSHSDTYTFNRATLLQFADALALECVENLQAENTRYREALELIAAPRRMDGTWNRDRAACKTLAVDALGHAKD